MQLPLVIGQIWQLTSALFASFKVYLAMIGGVIVFFYLAELLIDLIVAVRERNEERKQLIDAVRFLRERGVHVMAPPPVPPEKLREAAALKTIKQAGYEIVK